ncbi:MAG: hypothetical protein RIF39_06775 [Cyclobacteriaceae bacterium]
MKFEDMKKIWDEQDQQHKYVVDEKKLHETIQMRKRKGSRYVSKMEWMLIFANVLAGGVIIVMNFIKTSGDIYANGLGVLMLAAGIYIYTKRNHRLKNENRFDRTMLGDLDHAISNANYRARLSYGMLIYFIFVAILSIGNAMEEEKSLEKIGLIVVFFVITWFLGRWEHKAWHVANKKRLISMRDKLVEPI